MKQTPMRHALHALLLLSLSLPAVAAPRALEEVVVEGRKTPLLGLARSASEGVVGAEDLALRPLLRPGDVLEAIPGVVVTQHSGAGKSNQLFLRGFNLDHGTDFATWVDGMPVNLRSHGHGQGYTDINFLIPEMIDQLRFVKGPYHAELGDFSSAGGVHFETRRRVDTPTVSVSAGSNGYERLLAMASREQESVLTGALEAVHYDGPWRDVEENLQKLNGQLSLSGEREEGRWRVHARGYQSRWHSADQIPARAVAEGTLHPLGALDPALGGRSHRFSLGGDGTLRTSLGVWTAEAYVIDYRLRLWSNFTYGLDDPARGDQFEQLDDRRIAGGQGTFSWGENQPLTQRLGIEARHDAIDNVGLYRTVARQRQEGFRDDAVDQTSVALFYEGALTLSPRWRSVFGLRADHYDFSVRAADRRNSGGARESQLSPKASLIFSPSETLEAYLSMGRGFHSNDARGVTLRIDPQSGDAADPVDPLVPSTGAELGVKWSPRPGFNSALALWQLDLDSELLFVGDAGNTEATRGSERWGVEFNNFWQLTPAWRLEADLSWTHGRFQGNAPEGNRIPGAVPFVASSTLSYAPSQGPFATLRLRHLGAYPLTEDNTVKSRGSTLVNIALGWRWPRLRAQLDVLNALNAEDHDIDYFYASRLPGEPEEGIEDLHFKRFEPRQLRATVTLTL